MFKKGRIQNFAIGVLAIFIGLTTYLYLSTLNTRSASSSGDISVYVAVADISAGTSFNSMLQDGRIVLKQFPVSSISVDAISNDSNISPSLISSDSIKNGQLILRAMFAPAKNFASGLNIPKGDLAISISVDDVSRVANFVVPGSRVIIYSTGTVAKRGEAVTKILVTDALVLAVGPQVSTPAVGSQVPPSPLVTLAVQPIEASRIIHASQASKLSLALAHANEPGTVALPTTPISSSSLFGQG